MSPNTHLRIASSEPVVRPAALKPEDAAQYLGVSPVSVRRAIQRGFDHPCPGLSPLPDPNSRIGPFFG